MIRAVTRLAALLLVLGLGTTCCLGRDLVQPPPAVPETDQPEEEVVDLGARVGLGEGGGMVGGYIDPAIIVSRVRFRYDNVQGGNSDFAEFLYGGYGIDGHPRIQDYDYHEVSAYLEYVVSCRMSVFLDAPFRAASFDDLASGTRRDEAGLADLTPGLRYALIADGCDFLTAQLKVFVPTGDAQAGLGTGHASLQPGLLAQRNYDRLCLFGELHDWISLGDNVVGITGVVDPNAGELYGGNVLRYGVGAGYDVARCDERKLTLLGEVVGWSVLEGYRNLGTAAGNVTVDAAGDTMVNFKAGVRYSAGDRSLYVGYGFPLGSREVYGSILRVEYAAGSW